MVSKQQSSRFSGVLTAVFRIYLIAVFLAAFVPAVNPARLSGLISRNASLFTCATSYQAVASNFTRALNRGWVEQSALNAVFIGALITATGVALIAAAFCLSLGNEKMRRLGLFTSAAASLVGAAGVTLLRAAYNGFADAPEPERLQPLIPSGIAVFYALFAAAFVFSAVLFIMLPKPDKAMKYEIAPKYRLLLMILPFLVLVALFSYLPLWGWRVSFYDYRPGFEMTPDDFVGFRWFTFLLSNPATRADIMRVLQNTFAMSGLGLAFSWLPMAFAIFLSEITSKRTKRVVQTFTTIPNFISWVLVYSVAFAIFSTEGFLNWMLVGLGVMGEGVNHLMDSSNIWLKMWAWGTWKGLGFSAIIYIASISGIDPQLYEAATVDGAGRFKKMWHVTVPGLMSTFFVLLLLSISNILSNGMEQYLVFRNPANRSTIEVLDLYVYRLGLGSGSDSNYSLATLIGMLKSLISITLLFAANKASKWLRGESIV
jgi:putative aldouronate transport system permease protein